MLWQISDKKVVKMSMEAKLSKGIINKLIAARYSLNLAEGELSHSSEITLLTAINTLQDAVELFLLAITEHLNISISEKTKFFEYLEKIDVALTNSSTLSKILPELPFHNELIALNKTRVSSKHYGLIPNRQECLNGLSTSRAFMQIVCESIFQINFFAITLTDSLDDGSIKEILKEAEEYFLDSNFAMTLINCRKAIYLEFEKDYDIKQSLGLLGRFLCKAPYFAKNQDYIDKYVNEPTDYIVIDYNTLNTDLLKYKINLLDFYEITRLTPKVYQHNENWIVKEDFSLFDKEIVEENADYVLVKTIEILLSSHSNKRTKRKTSDKYFVINLNDQSPIPVYTKPDKASPIFGYIPENTPQVHSTYRTKNLSGEAFLFVADTIDGKSIQGFISSECSTDE